MHLRLYASLAIAAMAPTAIRAEAIQIAPAATERAPTEQDVSALFEAYAREAHAPGVVWGVVRDGRLLMVRGVGVQDPATGAPVTADTRFRIASMSKAFTALAILSLRDAGKLSLDDLAERHVPELRGWRYPTTDSPRIRIRDLLHHNAGFVDDNPWGDRQQILSEDEWTAMLKGGVPFATVPGTRYEYSNFGYATLGRIVANVSGMPYQRYIRDRIMTPLGMGSSGYDVLRSPAASRAIGYRFEDGAYRREPDLRDGAFGAMGGVETTANDYARYVAWLLSAWPARDGADTGPVKRSSVREIVQGSGYATLRPRRTGTPPCMSAQTYGMGWQVVQDCELSYVTHTGGYPGYGSVVMLVPEAGVGIFAFSNRTYGAPVAPTYEALRMMKRAGWLDPRPVPVTPRLAQAYAAVTRIWAAGDVGVARPNLAMNFLLDRSAEGWKRDLSGWKGRVGTCRTDTPITPTSMMAGRFEWQCDKGRLAGSVLLAPTQAATIQELRLGVVP